MVRTLHLFALMTSPEGETLRVFCDFEQNFVFERSDATTSTREIATQPRDFHDYTRALGQLGWSFEWAQHDPSPTQLTQRLTVVADI